MGVHLNGRLERALRGHEESVRHAAFSPPDGSSDGMLLVTASSDDTARFWDVEAGATRQRFVGHEDSVDHAAFSPDGKLLVTASKDYTTRLWAVPDFLFLKAKD